MSRDERPIGDVPGWLWAALAVTLALQVAWQGTRGPLALHAEDLPPPPASVALRLGAFGEAAAAARATLLYVQAFDLGGANALPYRNLDYARLAGWLETVLELDPRSEYPLFLAARVYTEIPDAARVRIMLDLVYRHFQNDPDRRWPWLAHAALLAKHRLNDLPLARTYAAAIERQTKSRDVPMWAKQMQIFILEDMNELEAAKVLLGGLLATGQIKDPAEARYMKQRLDQMEERLKGEKGQRPKVK